MSEHKEGEFGHGLYCELLFRTSPSNFLSLIPPISKMRIITFTFEVVEKITGDVLSTWHWWHRGLAVMISVMKRLWLVTL